MNGFVVCFFELLLGDILLWKVSKGTVRVFRGKLVLPWLIGLVVLLQEDSFELVLA